MCCRNTDKYCQEFPFWFLFSPLQLDLSPLKKAEMLHIPRRTGGWFLCPVLVYWSYLRKPKNMENILVEFANSLKSKHFVETVLREPRQAEAWSRNLKAQRFHAPKLMASCQPGLPGSHVLGQHTKYTASESGLPGTVVPRQPARQPALETKTPGFKPACQPDFLRVGNLRASRVQDKLPGKLLASQGVPFPFTENFEIFGYFKISKSFMNPNHLSLPTLTHYMEYIYEQFIKD